MNWKTISFIIILCAIFAKTFSQSHPDVSSYQNLFEPAKTEKGFSTKIDISNEIKLLMTGAFAFYKHFISSQDGVHCAFHPSCSVYALETIKLNGFLGILDAIDRLTRCNGFSPEKYEIHEKSNLLYDPVKKIH